MKVTEAEMIKKMMRLGAIAREIDYEVEGPDCAEKVTPILCLVLKGKRLTNYDIYRRTGYCWEFIAFGLSEFDVFTFRGKPTITDKESNSLIVDQYAELEFIRSSS